MIKIRVLSTLSLLLLVTSLCLAGGAPVAAQGPIATVAITPSQVAWQPQVEHAGAQLTLSGPGSFYLRREYAMGDVIAFAAQDTTPDGLYRYELRLRPLSGQIDPQDLVQSGSFTILDAACVVPGAAGTPTTDADPGGMQLAATTFTDDLIVEGSQCVGFDCVPTEDFGYDTIRLKENNLRIHFQDTSNSRAFPTTDWTLIANDSIDGGASYFAIEDRDAGRKLFVVEAGGPSNALYVDDAGQVGLGTATPAQKLHLWDDDSPAIRLDQSGSGWTSQVWDVGGNEAYFFVRDVTNGSALPLRIQPGAPSASLSVKNDGGIGMGTWYPGAALEIERTGADADLVLDRTDGVQVTMSAGSGEATLGTTGAHPVQVVVGNVPHTTFETDGNLTIEGGTLHQASNVYAKENFALVDPRQVLAMLSEVPISTWNFKSDAPDTRHMGPMAQDFYRTFELGMDERHIAPLDTNGVALASIQGLYEIVQDQEAQIGALQAENAKLSARLDALEAQIDALAAPQPALGRVLPWALSGALLLCGSLVVGRRFGSKGQEQ